MVSEAGVRVRAGGPAYWLEAGALLGVYRFEEMEVGCEGGDVLGWVRCGGERVGVRALTERLGGVAGAVCGGAVVALWSGQGAFAVAVDSVERMAGVGARRLPAVVAQARFRGVVTVEGELVPWLSADGLHPAAEAVQAESATGPETARADSGAVGEVRDAPRGGVLLFSLPRMDVMFALSVAQVLEVSSPARMWPVAGVREWVRGLVEWRGRAVPVVDLASCLGRGATPPEDVKRLLIARPARSVEPVALGIGAEIHGRPLPLPHQAWTGAVPFAMEYVRGLFEVGGYPLVVPDLDRMV
jgi:chemotaxis signal transduction protein